MRLCWDNIENIRLSKKKGNFYNPLNRQTYYLKVCKACGEEFLGRKKIKYCDHSCATSGKNNPMYGKKSAFKGKHHTEDFKIKMKKILTGREFSNETKRKMRKNHADVSGENNPMYGVFRNGKNSANWKGGYTSRSIPLYNTYAHQIDWCEEVRRSPDDENVLEVKCTYCGKWYTPDRYSVSNRLRCLKGQILVESRFYCSEHCKKACPIYGKTPEQLAKEDAVRAGRMGWTELNREVQPELRQMVLERDEYTCQKCDTQDKPLHCHHILPVATNPIESADVDNCITYCVDCHKQAHDQDGCRYKDLQTEIC